MNVKVVPGASSTHLVGRHGDGVRVRVAAAAEKGRANAAVVDLIATACGVAGSSVRVVRGHTSPSKVVEVDGIDDADLLRRLADAT